MALPWVIQQIKDLLAKFPVSVANGGTGLEASPSMLINLASTAADDILKAAPRPGVTGVLPIARGGTGQATAALARNALGLGNTTGPVPIANGGTGANTAAAARTNLGLTTGAPVPKAASGVGQWMILSDTAVVALPSGGTWAYYFTSSMSNASSLPNVAARAGVAAGGSSFSPQAGYTNSGGFCWRIA